MCACSSMRAARRWMRHSQGRATCRPPSSTTRSPEPSHKLQISTIFSTMPNRLLLGAPHLGVPGQLAGWGEHLALEMWVPNVQVSPIRGRLNRIAACGNPRLKEESEAHGKIEAISEPSCPHVFNDRGSVGFRDRQIDVTV